MRATTSGRPAWVSRREVIGAVVLAALIVVIEVVLVFSYVRGTETTRRFESTSSLVTSLANLQREVLRLHVELENLANGDSVTARREVDEQLAILRSQIKTVTAAGTHKPEVLPQVATISAEVDVIAGLMADLAMSQPNRGLGPLSDRLAGLERDTKHLYDTSEISYFGSTADSLESAVGSQLVQVFVGVAIAGVGVLLALQMRRRVRGEFAKAYIALEAEMGERERAERALRHQAYHDALTGAPNRTLFLERLEETVTAGDHDLAVLFIDLDDFKTINDSLGHATGDALLTAVVDRIGICLRRGDMVARMGGDEFAVLLADLDAEVTAESVARRIIGSLRRPFSVAGSVVSASATVGIATAVRGATVTAGELLRNADLAMYAAKASGKDRYEAYRPQMHDDALRRLGERTELERALAKGEFVLHYQPIVDLTDGSIPGVEALVRWQHPERGLVAPGAFIGTAEESGLIVPIGRWVLEEACRQVAAWKRDRIVDDTFELSVNLSPRQLRDEDLVRHVASALAESGMSARSLTLEMTETVLVDDIDTAAATLARLKSLGVQLAIDDFGTGYSSIGYLAQLPIDVLKLDRSFVAAASDASSPGARLARTILGIGRSVGLPSVAEGIETAAQVQLVRELGCQFGQGYLFARPVDATSIAPMLGEKIAAAAPPRDRMGARRARPIAGVTRIAPIARSA
jgi:diguanylate cyclase (GGDEF)-like protein